MYKTRTTVMRLNLPGSFSHNKAIFSPTRVPRKWTHKNRHIYPSKSWQQHNKQNWSRRRYKPIFATFVIKSKTSLSLCLGMFFEKYRSFATRWVHVLCFDRTNTELDEQTSISTTERSPSLASCRQLLWDSNGFAWVSQPFAIKI